MLPADTEKAAFVRAMFDRIAPRYDRLNRVISFHLDQYWRRQAIAMVSLKSTDTVIDLACGTGDFCGLALDAHAQVIGVDFAMNMLTIAQRRHAAATFVQADAEKVPLPPAWASVVLSGFALRNFVSIPRVLAEAARLLETGGRLALLDVDTPPNWLFRFGHNLYFSRIVPFLGSLFSDAKAYAYLPRSVSYLPRASELYRMIENAEFTQIQKHSFTGGIVQLLTAVRQ